MQKILTATLIGATFTLPNLFLLRPSWAQDIIFPPARRPGQPRTTGAGTRAIPRPPDVPEFPEFPNYPVEPAPDPILIPRPSRPSRPSPQPSPPRPIEDLKIGDIDFGIYNATEDLIWFILNDYFYTLEPGSYIIFERWSSNTSLQFVKSYDNGEQLTEYELNDREWYFFDETPDGSGIELYTEESNPNASNTELETEQSQGDDNASGEGFYISY